VQGKRIRTPHLEVRILASPLLHPRIGFIVPRYGRSAVERNRLKRQLREIVRTRLLAELPSIDMLVRTRPNTYKVAFAVLIEELIHAVKKALVSLQ
jgi:ribonuclease P protein component